MGIQTKGQNFGIKNDYNDSENVEDMMEIQEMNDVLIEFTTSLTWSNVNSSCHRVV